MIVARQWIVLLLLLGAVSGNSEFRQAWAEDRILVAASIAPLADFIRQVAGPRAEVITLVPPGASPHVYELKPSQVRQVARAHLLVLNGAGLEYWADKLVRSAESPVLRMVDTSRGIELLEGGHHGGNPHIWLDVRQAMAQVAHIRDALIRADPGHADTYRTNATRYLDRLNELDRAFAEEIRGWTQRRFIAFHPAWIYFARRYGLEQVGAVERSPGREPSPKEIAGLVADVRRFGIRSIFSEPQFSPKAADAIAKEAGVRVIVLDPLGTSLEDASYVAMMRHNVDRMAEVMR